MTTPTTRSMRMAVLGIWVDTALATRECCCVHSFASAMMGRSPSTVADHFQARGLNSCEIRVDIPISPMAPWTRAVIRSEVDDAIEKMAHMQYLFNLQDNTGRIIIEQHERLNTYDEQAAHTS
jgi:hypothetical protein